MEIKVNIYFPIDVIVEILSRLPVKSLLRLKCACRPWRDWICDTDFIKLHLNRSLDSNLNNTIILGGNSSRMWSIDIHALDFCAAPLYCPKNIDSVASSFYIRHLPVGSINGLVCFGYVNYFALYNHATRAIKTLPWLSIKFNTYSTHHVYFAYDCMSDDYIVLNYVQHYSSDIELIDRETHLYNLKTNSWTIIENPPRIIKGWCSYCSNVTNNSMHWISKDDNDIPTITCFNLFTHEFEEIVLPRVITGVTHKLSLAILRGHLHIVTKDFDIWIMKEYGVNESWTRLFHCLPKQLKRIRLWPDDSIRPELLAYSKDESKILVACETPLTNFMWCDLEFQAINKAKIDPKSWPKESVQFLSAEPWVESLVPLK